MVKNIKFLVVALRGHPYMNGFWSNTQFYRGTSLKLWILVCSATVRLTPLPKRRAIANSQLDAKGVIRGTLTYVGDYQAVGNDNFGHVVDGHRRRRRGLGALFINVGGFRRGRLLLRHVRLPQLLQLLPGHPPVPRLGGFMQPPEILGQFQEKRLRECCPINPFESFPRFLRISLLYFSEPRKKLF